MKIVIFSFYSGWVQRGMETVVAELAKRFRKHHQVMVIKPNFPVLSGLATPGVAMGVAMARKLFLDFDSRRIFQFTLKSWSRMERFNPDFIIPANGGWQSLLMKLYCVRHKAKLVILGQAGLGWDDRWNLLFKPDLFVALSDRNLRWAKQHSWTNQSLVKIPNGVDLEKFRVKSQESRVKGPFFKALAELERPVVLCVAGPEGYKRVGATIHAVAHLKKGSLVVIGGSQTTSQLGKELLGNRFLQDKVVHDKMPQVYRQATVFTLVSESTEAFGIAYVEAMACGLPVVATDDELRREIVGKAGMFVGHPDDSAVYAQALETAAEKEWGDLPRNQAKKFSWDTIAAQYEKEFNKMVK